MKLWKSAIGLLCVIGAASATAQVPSGKFTYVFTNLPLWDVSGTYTNESASPGGADLSITTLAQSAKGAVTGTRTDSVADGSKVSAKITGNVTVKKGVVGASLKISGTASADGYTGPATGTSTATLDLPDRSLDVAGKFKLCVKTPRGTKCETLSGIVTNPMPAGVTGDWTLETDITAVATKLSGTGTLTLSTGRVFTYKIVGGSYKTTTGVAKLNLIGQSAASGTSLSLTTHGVGMDLTALKGNLLGQKPVFP